MSAQVSTFLYLEFFQFLFAFVLFFGGFPSLLVFPCGGVYNGEGDGDGGATHNGWWRWSIGISRWCRGTKVNVRSLFSVFFLTASVVHFLAMRNTLANIWHPVARIHILDLREKHFLFKFYHWLDIERVIKGAPWTFNNHLLVFHQLVENKDPMQVPLIYYFFWGSNL